MKKGLCLALLVLVTVYAGKGLCLQAGDKPVIRTDKTMYLLDPYYWVYSAANFKYWWPNAPDPDLWQDGGHAVVVNFIIEGYFGASELTYRLEGLATGERNGILCSYDGYAATIDISEEDVGGEDFKPGEKDIDNAPVVPKALTLTVEEEGAAGEPIVVATRTIKINRWGCDRCHLGAEIAREIYPWSNPSGGLLGPHYWGNILGRNSGRPGFTHDNLTDATLTHTPTAQGIVGGMPASNPLDRPPYHQKTNIRQCGNKACAPCHQGHDGTPRTPAFITGRDDYDMNGKSLAVKCVFCHGIDGGYVPDSAARPLWEDWYMESWQ
jgi:hypothetical protein